MHKYSYIFIKTANEEMAAIRIKEKYEIVQVGIFEGLSENQCTRPYTILVHMWKPHLNGLQILA